MSRARHYSFTVNNFNDNHLDLLRTCVSRNTDIQYVIFGQEVGETGTPHLQGYLQLSGGKRIRTVHSLLGFSDLHMEAALGSDENNFTYCSKDGQFEEFGERQTIRAKRAASNTENTQYENLMAEIREGASLIQIASSYPKLFIKHHAGIVRAHSLFLRKPFPIKHGPWKWNITHDWNTSLWLWGPAGIGKTCYAQSLLPNALFASHMDQLKGYDPTNYEGIIFDDMAFSHLPREAQIHLVDTEQDRAIHCRHTCAWIPAGTKKIFLSNTVGIFLDDPAITRRLTIINLKP